MAQDGERDIETTFSIRFEPAANVRGEFERAELSPHLESPRFQTPAFSLTGVNDFEPSVAYRTPSENYFWYCFDAHPFCAWDLSHGYRSTGSLKITQAHPRSSAWQFGNLSVSYLQDFVPLSGRYRLTGWVKARGARGVVRLRFSSVVDESIAYAIDGDTDWFPVELDVLGASGHYNYSGSNIALEFDGMGEVWFDDISFRRN